MFKLYRQNFTRYLYLLFVFLLFLIIPQIALNHWFNSKIDELEGINLREFDGTPMIYYFNSEHKSKSVKVDWDVIEEEGISETYKMKAQYGLAVVKREYETKFINTEYGEIIKKGMNDYFRNYPNIDIDKESIEGEIEEILDAPGLDGIDIGMDYIVNVDSAENYAYITITTYYTSDEDYQMVDFIYYSF